MGNVKSLLLVLSLSFSYMSYSQTWGDPMAFSFLKGEKEICLKFNYDELMVEDIWKVKSIWKIRTSGELKTEKEFLLAKAEEYDKKEVGQGELWVQNWELNKKSKFEPKFEKFFNKGTKHKLLGKRFVDSLKYTIQIHIKEMHLGMNGGFAVCNFEVLVFETAKPETILSKTQMYQVYGLKYNRQQNLPPFPKLDLWVSLISGTFPSKFTHRIKDCYAECGRDLGEEIRLSCRPRKRFLFDKTPQ